MLVRKVVEFNDELEWRFAAAWILPPMVTQF